MSLVSVPDMLQFLSIQQGYFIVNASSDQLIFSIDGGISTTCTINDGTYTASSLASSMSSILTTTFGLSVTVTWDSTTNLFTFAVPAGHTIAYTHAGSSLGFWIGFTQDHAAALSIITDQSAESVLGFVGVIQAEVEQRIKEWCQRDFEVTTYQEWYNGTGDTVLYLKQFPIISINRINVDTLQVISIQNNNTVTNATVSANSTGLQLMYNNVVDTSITWAAYPTLSQVVSAINNLGSGWYALLQSADYNNYLSSEIRPCFALNTIWGQVQYLTLPWYLSTYQYEVYPNSGYIETTDGSTWNPGQNNIYCVYTAGYPIIPGPVQEAVKILVKIIYTNVRENLWLPSSYSLGDLRITIKNELLSLPKSVTDNLQPYKLWEFVQSY